MVDPSEREIKLFYCYAREDKALRSELETHLSWLKRRYHLTNWHDREILPGEDWELAIDTHLNSADLILLLISPNFMASDYCYGKEMQRALERHKEGTCRVVPILLRPTYLEGAPFSRLQLLPTDAKPITKWSDRDEAFQDIVTEISRIIKDILNPPKTKEAWLEKGRELLDLGHNEEALTAFEQSIRLDPDYASAYSDKSTALLNLRRNEEVLATSEQAIRLDPNDANAYFNKGTALGRLNHHEEALAAFEQVIRLDPNYVRAYNNKGRALMHLGRDQEADQAFEKAYQINQRKR
jgi:tetratricopeptide (TPR) repeat protein